MSRMRWVFMAVVLASSGAAATEGNRSEPGPLRAFWSFAQSLFAQAAPAPVPGPLAQAKPGAGLPAPEQVAVPPPPRFDIERFDVRGNSLLTTEEIAAAVAPYTGKSKDFADVQRALESVQDRFQQRGFGAVQVVLPEQELERGVIVLQVIEPKLGRVTIEGNQYFDQANIRRSLPALQEGATPNAHEIGRNARLANENPAKRTTVLLRAGKTEGEMDAAVRVQDEKFWRAAVSFDNTGSPATGMYRVGVAYQHANLFNLDNVVTLQYQFDPEPIEDWNKLKVFAVGYRIPFYGHHSSLDLLAGFSDIGSTNAPGVGGTSFNFSGSGTILGVRYNFLLPKPDFLDEFDHRLSVGLDYKAYSNEVRPIVGGVPGANVTPDVTVHPASLTYSATRRMENAEFGFFGSYVKNVYPHGSDATADSFGGPSGARPGVGRSLYGLFRYGVNYARAFPHDIQLRANLTGQFTRDALVPGEQFGLGGWDNLRGLHEREGASDKGYRGSIEIYSPDVARHFGLDGGRLRFLGFVDFGRVKINHREAAQPCGSTSCGFSASSVGFGMRLALRQGVTVRVDYGQLLDGGVLHEAGHDRWHFGMSVAF